jgi:hypothetical protein
MAEAWQKREFKQQEFLNGIVRTANRAAADDDHDTFFLALTTELARELIAQRTKAQRGTVLDRPSLDAGDQLAQSYAGRFIRTITGFSRTPQEAANLLGRLLVKFAESGLSKINAAYLHQTVHEPQLLYEGHGSMDEVPFLGEA